ncbi:glutamate receptor ionotropic, delta-2 [Trichonephila clavipes]|nr:glutamate receptor ionotropic, delta-2 [Trichonephila clavipes]
MKFPKFLKVAVINLEGVCDLNVNAEGKLELDGSEKVFIELLSDAFQFNYELVQPSDKDWGQLQEDGNWSGLIGMVQRGEADIGLCSVLISEERQKAVSFTQEYDIKWMVFATRLPRKLPGFMNIVLPFSLNVWLCILILLIVMPFLWKCFLKTRYTFRTLFMFLLASLMKQSINIKYQGFKECSIIGSWFAAATMICFSYSVVLLSFLTLPVKENIIRTLPELSKAVSKGTYECYILQGTMALDYLQNSQLDYLLELGKAIENNKWWVEPKRESIEKVIKEGQTAVIANAAFFLDIFQNELALSEDYIVGMRTGLAMNNNFCCKKALNKKMRQIIQAGFYQEWMESLRFYSRFKSNASEPDPYENMRRIGMKDMLGAFLLLGIGYAISIIILFCEIILGKF